jgi:hypothetical protein
MWALSLTAEEIRKTVCLAELRTVFYHLAALRRAGDARAAPRRATRAAA